MTDEQINVAIAEACGWKNCKVLPKPQKYWDVSDVPEMCRIGSPPVAGSCTFPNYCADLNAMHETEKVLSAEQIAKYFWTLCDTSKKNNPFMATSRQRAEAFLRTLGKWEGD
jgi:hypothetical protein